MLISGEISTENFYTLQAADREYKSKTIPSNRLKTNSLKGDLHINNKLTVFLAEDDADDQEMLMEMMKAEDERLTFVTASTGSKAVDILRKMENDQLPCLIILDYNLPEMSGAEILAKLIDEPRYKDTVKIVWSTSNSPIYQKKCMELGAQSYIVKPTGIAGIKAIAKQLVELCLKTQTS